MVNFPVSPMTNQIQQMLIPQASNDCPGPHHYRGFFCPSFFVLSVTPGVTQRGFVLGNKKGLYRYSPFDVWLRLLGSNQRPND